MKQINNLKHIALILDGNKRWSKKENVSLFAAYKKGFQNIELISNSCLDLGISHLTLFTLSSENIKRGSVNNIFQIIYEYFNDYLKRYVNEKKIKIKIIGRRENLPNKIIEIINKCEKLTANNKLLN